MEKEKTIYNLTLHETLVISETVPIETRDGTKDMAIKKYEVTRIAGGWVYAFEFPGWRQTQVVFVPFNNEFQVKNKIK